MMDDTPTYCFVLVRADEGSTQDIVVAHGTSLDALGRVIFNTWTAAIAACDGPYAADNQTYLTREYQALLAMLEAHGACTPGRYSLPHGVAPFTEYCTLVITAQDGAWFPA